MCPLTGSSGVPSGALVQFHCSKERSTPLLHPDHVQRIDRATVSVDPTGHFRPMSTRPSEGCRSRSPPATGPPRAVYRPEATFWANMRKDEREGRVTTECGQLGNHWQLADPGLLPRDEEIPWLRRRTTI